MTAEELEPSPVGLSAGRLARLARKELRETLRDRRTILTLVLMPLFVYPLLGLTFQKFLLSQSAALGGPERPEYMIGFASQHEAEVLRPFLEAGDAANARQTQRRTRAAPADEPRDGDASSRFPVFKGHWPEKGTADVGAMVDGGLVDLGMVIERAGEEQTQDAPVAVRLIFNSASPNAVALKRELEDRFEALNAAWYRSRLREAGVTDPPPVRVAVEARKSKTAAGISIASVLPLILLLMTMTGAVYPAIDLTAGERERGTLEALVAAPVSRRAVLTAKYAAVFTVAVLTAGMNLLAMTATAYAMGLDTLLLGSGLTLGTLFQVVALILVLAAFFSAVLLFVTSFARSFKEAQAYLIPLTLVSLAPGIVSLMPEIQLTGLLAVTPLVGVVLLGRDLLSGGADPLMIAACVVSTALYATVALVLAARVFGTDAVLYGSTGTWTELFRRPEESQSAPPLTVAAGCLAAVFPAFLLLGPLPGRFEGVGVAGRLVASAVVTALLFFVMPAIATISCRAKFASTFRWHASPWLGIAAALLLGLSLWPFAYELELFTLSPDRVEALRKLFEPIRAQLDAVPLWVKLVTLAVVPAVCEEWFFRGFLLSSFRTRLRAWPSILATGMLFGAFHVVVRDGLFLERFVPTAFLGLVLGFVCVRTGSLWPGIVLHGLHNGLLLSLAAFEKELIARGWTGGDGTHLPWTWLAAAAAAVLAGIFLLSRCRRSDAFRKSS